LGTDVGKVEGGSGDGFSGWHSSHFVLRLESVLWAAERTLPILSCGADDCVAVEERPFRAALDA
jgi:hypothetical protein